MSRVQKIIDHLLSEEDNKDGANLDLRDLEHAYTRDYTGQSGFMDHYFVRRDGNSFVYRVLGHNPRVRDEPADYFVTEVILKPATADSSEYTLDFAGQPDVETEDLGAARELFNDKRPPTDELEPPVRSAGPPAPSRYRQPKGFTPGRNKWQDANWRATQDRGW